jgi:hypothetical protein
MASLRFKKLKNCKVTHKILHKLHQYSNTFASDHQIKIITFIEFFIGVYTNSEVKDIINETDECGIFHTYVSMINDLTTSKNKDDLITHIKFLNNSERQLIIQLCQYDSALAKQITDLVKQHDKTIDETELVKFLTNVIKYFYVNYATLKFHASAAMNLSDNYTNKIDCAKLALTLMDSIKNNLINLVPKNIDSLMMLINTLSERMY